MQAIITKYFEILLSCFQYDVNVFSQHWLYWWLLIPAIFYFMFFMLKWTVLTAPLWIPLMIIYRGLIPFTFTLKEKPIKRF